MITGYDERPGVGWRLRSSGLPIEIANGIATTPDDITAQAIIDAWTVADSAAWICAEIDEHARSLRDAAVAGVSAAEMATWPIKRAEALAWQADASAATPILSAEAVARGSTVAAIATRVLGNAARLGGLEAAISGTAGLHKDAVRACTTFAAVAAYDWRLGWPA